MNDLYLHLVINHLPIVGALLSIPLLLLALWRRSDRGALLAAVLVLVVTGVGGILASRTGDGAEHAAEELVDVREADIEEHEERAELATPLAVFTALAGLAVLFVTRRRTEPVPAILLILLLVAAMCTSAAMMWTAAAGGIIRHTEIREAPDMPRE